jgi:hypothetical protein
MSDKPRGLHIRPHVYPNGSEGFAIWLDNELKATGNRYEVEEAIGRFQADLDAGRLINDMIGGLIVDEEARAEIERLKGKIKDASEHGREGQTESLEKRQDDAAFRAARVDELTENVAKAHPDWIGLQVVKEVQKVWETAKWPAEEREICKKTVGRETVYKSIRRLVEAKTIKPPPRKK